MLLLPMIEDGPAGAAILSGLERRKLNAFMASVSGLTVLSGVWLYWHFTAGFNPALSATRGAICFGIGGAAGFLALILGGSVVGRSAKMAVAAADQAAALPEGKERAALLQRATDLRHRMASAAKIVVVLLLIAVACMAVGHYV